MLRSPFRRARQPEAQPPHAAAAEALGPEELDLIARACRGDVPAAERIGLVARLERTPPARRPAIARALVPALASPPDVAARVHLALLVLEPALAIARSTDGGYVAASRLIHETDFDGVARTDAALGRVAGLDALGSLFAAHEDPPLFLQPAPHAAPQPYRPSHAALARRDEERERHRKRDERRQWLRALGLDEEDLEDDPDAHLRVVPRRVLRRDAPAAISIDSDRPVHLVTDETCRLLGRAHRGEWWSDLRVGDHKGAQRFHVRLAREDASPELRVRRLTNLGWRRGVVGIVFGTQRLEHVVAGRGLVVWVEEDGPLVVGVTLSWSTHGSSMRGA